MKNLDCYCDGSFNEFTKNASWAFIIVENDKIIHKNKGIITDENFNSGRQIAGECFGVIKSLEWAKENDIKLKIHFDYIGLKCWIDDLFNQKPWKTNKEYTILYRKKVLELRENLDKMVKIKSHSGDKYNEWVDSYAKSN